MSRPCDQCGAGNAILRFTRVKGYRFSTTELCEDCSRPRRSSDGIEEQMGIHFPRPLWTERSDAEGVNEYVMTIESMPPIRRGPPHRSKDAQFSLRLGEWIRSAERDPEMKQWTVHLIVIPGGRLLRGAEFLLSKKSYEQIFEPLMSDVWVEYTEAVDAGREWKARWIRIRGYYTFVATFCVHCFSSVGLLIVRAVRGV